MANDKLFKFKVVHGSHTQTDPDGTIRSYSQGQVCECKTDLTREGKDDKFETMPDDTKVSVGATI